MANAWDLVDHVIPPVSVRQWVISVPKRLRCFLADRQSAVAALTSAATAPATARGWSIEGQNPNLRTGAIHGGRSVQRDRQIHDVTTGLGHEQENDFLALGDLALKVAQRVS